MVRTKHEFRPPKSICVISGANIPVYVNATGYFIVKLNEKIVNYACALMDMQAFFNPNMRVHVLGRVYVTK
jgi:hypothetical protein